MTERVVALLTDFGVADHFVATMKGVILSQAPGTSFIDITHDIPPQGVAAAAYQLLASYHYQPAGTLFLCSVDGGKNPRRLLYVEAGRWRFLAPDNGLLSWVLNEEKPKLMLDVTHAPGLPPAGGRTFDGRDVLAPLAGRLLTGEPISPLGPSVSSIETLPFPAVQKNGALWRGRVIARDRFGNAVTNLRSSELGPLAATSKLWFEFGPAKTTIRGLSESYTSVESGRMLAVKGSAGFVEISIRDGNAAQAAGLNPGDEVLVYFRT